MLVGRKLGSSPDVRSIKRNLAWRLADRACADVLDRLSLQYVLYPSSFAVVGDPWFQACDVVQLHNTHGSYFSHSALPLLSRRRPVVWFLQDQWAFTGHVAYSYDCERWRNGCGLCPYLHEYPGLARDTTATLWRWKRNVYARSRLTVVAPSRWLARLASESPLLSRFPVRRIPNSVDLERYKPQDQAAARIRLDLDPDRRVVLFSAFDLDDRRMGGTVLARALERLRDLDFELVLAGGSEPPGLGRPVRALGRIDQDETMADVYSAADIFALPTLAENLSNALLESSACGIPAVSFDVGGVPDVVRHLDTGYLAPVGDADGLAEGIRLLLREQDVRARLGENARRLAETEFSLESQATSFGELYEELIEERSAGAVALA